MGDIMFTIEKIEESFVTLEDRNNNTLIDVKKSILPPNIKEGDILDLINNEYIINILATKEIKKNIRNKFESLIN